ncbi:hypothetical protein BKA66DRAFT_438620 [Pyrenochaeta sp. MPI-SDFR-AT-0127]|nr:hypothetical protein BKA66DRAFT_438620 [Pyrenochaeta sp. MPI-SDFR-AT-0127]
MGLEFFGCVLMQISLPILPEAEDLARFALLGAWLRWCDGSHNCNKDHVGSNTELPTRLLYVGGPNDPDDILHLYYPKENDRMEYIALSHCWGKLAEEDKLKFCTTDHNIELRLKGFSLSELPKTFRDAIQGNEKDWEDEAKRMEGVFASAYCTIAATSDEPCMGLCLASHRSHFGSRSGPSPKPGSEPLSFGAHRTTHIICYVATTTTPKSLFVHAEKLSAPQQAREALFF